MMSSRVKKIITLSLVTIVLLGIVALIVSPFLFASVAYPLCYRDEIKAATTKYHRNPNFIAALIYTESTCKPNARSGAGATGIMQIMPSTGASIAKRLGYSSFDLNDPKTNIEFGTYYIDDAINRNGGDVKLGLIAYNGGQGAVSAYQLGYPISGTVAYANKIMSLQGIYQKTYGNWWEEGGGSVNGYDIQPNETEQPVGVISIWDFWRLLIK